jgi:hypothetical protein
MTQVCYKPGEQKGKGKKKTVKFAFTGDTADPHGNDGKNVDVMSKVKMEGMNSNLTCNGGHRDEARAMLNNLQWLGRKQKSKKGGWES